MLSEQFLIEIILKRDDIDDATQYPFCLDALNNFDRLRLHPKVTFFVGENGSGKSTLLEAIAVANGFNPEGGSKNFGFSTRESHSSRFFNVATEIESLDNEFSFGPPVIESYGGKSLHEQSHGESFFALLMNRFSGDSLFVLDEPEAALSPSRQLTFLSRMHELIGLNSQFVIATHSPIIMAYPDAKIMLLGADGLQDTAYEDTEHFQVTKSFINNRETMLRELLN